MTTEFIAIPRPMLPVITLERPDTAEAIELITELEAHLESFYPRESRHGYSVDKLIEQGLGTIARLERL